MHHCYFISNKFLSTGYILLLKLKLEGCKQIQACAFEAKVVQLKRFTAYLEDFFSIKINSRPPGSLHFGHTESLSLTLLPYTTAKYSWDQCRSITTEFTSTSRVLDPGISEFLLHIKCKVFN